MLLVNGHCRCASCVCLYCVLIHVVAAELKQPTDCTIEDGCPSSTLHVLAWHLSACCCRAGGPAPVEFVTVRYAAGNQQREGGLLQIEKVVPWRGTSTSTSILSILSNGSGSPTPAYLYNMSRMSR